MDFNDFLPYQEGVNKGKYLENDPCTQCGGILKIRSDLIPRLKHSAKSSPIGMARYFHPGHGDRDHHRSVYYDRNMKYVGNIVVGLRHGMWYIGEDEPEFNTPSWEIWETGGISEEDWNRVLGVLTSQGNGIISFNSVLLGIKEEFSNDKGWEGFGKVMSFISNIGRFGILIYCGGKEYNNEVPKEDGWLEINYNQVQKLIYK